jgi:outer membrane lipoprotein-sorting protein
MKASIGIAASVMVGAVLWTLFPAARPAYALADLPQRLRSIDTLHLKGTIFASDAPGEGHSIEIFLQRPDRIRINGYMGYSPKGAISYDNISTPEHRIIINSADKSAVIAPSSAADQRMNFEQLFQMEVVTLMIGPSPQSDFKKLRTEPLDGIAADVYQSDHTGEGMSDRMVVWLDPSTGLPVKAQSYMKFPGKPEHLAEELDTIEAGVPIPPGTFDFQPPADYKVSYTDEAPTLESGSAGHTAVDVRFGFDVGQRGVLLCWRAYDQRHPALPYDAAKDGSSVTFVSEKGVQYAQQLLHSDPVPTGPAWRWSFLLPLMPTDPADKGLTLIVRDRARDTLSLGFRPVQLNEDDQKRLIEQAQSLTMPPGATPVPLEQLEDQSAK